MKKSKTNSRLIFAVLAILIIILGITVFRTPLLTEKFNITTEKRQNSYRSNDLRISFVYPNGWYVDEKEFDIILTSYQTKIGENRPPNTDQIKIFIDEFANCFPTLEEDLEKPGCGEGGAASRNTILSQDSKTLAGGQFHTYVIRQSNGETKTQYFLVNEEKILQISKQPDPSQFEKEFEEIVNSIRFL